MDFNAFIESGIVLARYQEQKKEAHVIRASFLDYISNGEPE